MDSDLFYQAVKCAFNNWTALQLAISHRFGGSDTKEKAELFINDTHQWMVDNRDIEDYELEAYFEDTMNTEFNSILEDGSALQLARQLVKYYGLYKSNRWDELRADLEVHNKNHQANLSASKKVKNNENDDDDDDSSSSGSEDDGDDDMDTGDGDETAEGARPSRNEMDPQEAETFNNQVEEGWTFVAKSGKHFTK